jgi:hypothetical protein
VPAEELFDPNDLIYKKNKVSAQEPSSFFFFVFFGQFSLTLKKKINSGQCHLLPSFSCRAMPRKENGIFPTSYVVSQGESHDKTAKSRVLAIVIEEDQLSVYPSKPFGH